jgi:hypothetical protein
MHSLSGLTAMNTKSFPTALAAFILLSLSLAACAGPAKGRKPSVDWSRGLPIGARVDGAVTMVVPGSGTPIHLAWPTTIDGRTTIHYTQLDAGANVVVDRDLQLAAGAARSPKLLMAGNRQLHLVWAARPEGERPWTLWYNRLDERGEFVGEATRLSAIGTNTGSYSVTGDASGRSFVVWEDRVGGAVYAQSLTASGIENPVPLIVADAGRAPAARLDASGNLHLVWLDGSRFFYTTLSRSSTETAPARLVAYVNLGTGDSLSGPVLGLTDVDIFVLWAISSQSGLEAGTARTEYVTFPLRTARLTPSRRLWLLPVEEQPYGTFSGAYELTRLAPPATAAFGTDYLYDPVTAEEQGQTMAVAVTARQAYRSKQFTQIALALFQSGEFVGYQMASKTEGFSGQAVIGLDAAGHLYLAWREGAGRANVYFATTAPQARAELDRISTDDVTNAFLVGAMDALVGVLFFPFAMIWILPGILLLGVWKLIKDEDSVTIPHSLLLLVIAILLYQVTKLLFLPTIQTYTPFSAWLDLPRSWSTALRVIVPLLIFGVAWLAAEWVRRSRTASTLAYFFVVAAVDAILTLVVYGVNYLGVF